MEAEIAELDEVPCVLCDMNEKYAKDKAKEQKKAEQRELRKAEIPNGMVH